MTTVRLLLNSAFTGANAFFALAESSGRFRDAGLDVQYTPGRGAYTAAERLMEEDFDAAYGDLNALIEIAASRAAADLPIGVFMVHQHSPCSITVARAGPIHDSAGLAGKKIIGHRSDVALRTFGAFASGAGLTPESVEVQTSDAGMGELLLGMLQGQADGVFGYVTTHTAALASAGRSATEVARFLPYRDVCPALYGSALMVAPRFMRDQSDVVTRLVRALRDSIVAAHSEPQAAIEAVIARNPQANRRIELKRWMGTLIGDMACPLGLRDGLGDVDDRRLGSSIACLSSALGWSRIPAVEQVFTRRFLAGM